jgi:uncharacterized repeat protein (TIGR02543 family)
MRRFKVALTVITLAISGLSASPAFAGSDGLVNCVTDGAVTGSGSFTVVNNVVMEYWACTGRAVIPDGVTDIDIYAFYQAPGLTSVTIPASVTTIGKGAFRGTTALTSISVDPGNTYYKSINGVLFNKSGKTLIHYPVELNSTSYAIPSGVTTIGVDAFRSASRLTSVIIPSGVISIGDDAFNLATRLTSVTIPASVTTIGDSAFNRTRALRSVTFKPSSKLKIIGEYAFYGTTSLTSITIPASVRTLDEMAFADATSLTAVNFEPGSTLTTIDTNAFDSASSLTSITIPSSVTTIGSDVFSGTSALTSIYFLGNAPASVNTDAFIRAGDKDGVTAYRKSSATGFTSPGSQWKGLKVAIGVYTATFNSNGGTPVKSADFIKNGSIAIAPKTPTRSGYKFAGWSASKGGSAITFPYTPMENRNITLHAKWTKSTDKSTPAIEFSTSSIVLTKANKSALKKLANSSGKDASYVVTGTAGRLPGVTEAQVKNLAKLRANVVKTYLVKLGVKKSNIKIKTKIVNQGIVPKTKVLTRNLVL